MFRLVRLSILGVLLAALVVPALALELKQPESRRYVVSVEKALIRHKETRGRWPATVAQLRSYAKRIGQPIDMAPLKALRLVPRSADTMGVEYELKSAPGKKGAFAVTLITIK